MGIDILKEIMKDRLDIATQFDAVDEAIDEYLGIVRMLNTVRNELDFYKKLPWSRVIELLPGLCTVDTKSFTAAQLDAFNGLHELSLTEGTDVIQEDMEQWLSKLRAKEEEAKAACDKGIDAYLKAIDACQRNLDAHLSDLREWATTFHDLVNWVVDEETKP